MKEFKRNIIRIALIASACVFVFAIPINLLKLVGIGGAIPTLILGGTAIFLSRFFLKKYNERCADKDSHEIKNYTDINRDQK